MYTKFDKLGDNDKFLMTPTMEVEKKNIFSSWRDQVQVDVMT